MLHVTAVCSEGPMEIHLPLCSVAQTKEHESEMYNSNEG